MTHLPIFMDIKGRQVLVVGGGELATRKVEMILKAEGRVRLVADSLCLALEELVDLKAVEHHARAFDADDLVGCLLVFVATDDEELCKRVAKQATEADILVNVVDQFDLCTFIMPAIVNRSPVMVASSWRRLPAAALRRLT